jgi:hypothetical protein
MSIALAAPFSRESMKKRLTHLPGFGGKFLNMFLISPSSMLVFFPALEDKFSEASPRQSSCFVLLSKRSMTRLATS